MKTPEGWKLVPVEPTEEMLVAALVHTSYEPHRKEGLKEEIATDYRLVLAAAPTPPAQEPDLSQEARDWYAKRRSARAPAQDETQWSSRSAVPVDLAYLQSLEDDSKSLNKLRKAAEEVIDRFYNGKCDGELEESVINLRAALEGK